MKNNLTKENIAKVNDFGLSCMGDRFVVLKGADSVYDAIVNYASYELDTYRGLLSQVDARYPYFVYCIDSEIIECYTKTGLNETFSNYFLQSIIND